MPLPRNEKVWSNSYGVHYRLMPKECIKRNENPYKYVSWFYDTCKFGYKRKKYMHTKWCESFKDNVFIRRKRW